MTPGGSGGEWRFGVWHVAPDGTWWAPAPSEARGTWREAFDAAFACIGSHPDRDAKASVRKVYG